MQVLHHSSEGVPSGCEGNGTCPDGTNSPGNLGHPLPGGRVSRHGFWGENRHVRERKANQRSWTNGLLELPRSHTHTHMCTCVHVDTEEGTAVDARWLIFTQIDETRISQAARARGSFPKYLNLVATSSSFRGRKATRVTVSKRRGHIFIQTDQPIYNPTQPGSKKLRKEKEKLHDCKPTSHLNQGSF